jgi:polygalacturonase
VSGANGTVDGITYRNTQMSGGDDYGIIVMQSYNEVKSVPTNRVKVTNFVLQNVTGTVLNSALNVYVECGVGSCEDRKWTGVSVTGGKNATTFQNVPEGISC